MPPPQFIVAELLASADGHVRLRVLASNLRQGAAVAIVRDDPEREQRVLVVGEPRLRLAHVFLPAAVATLGLGRRSVLAKHVGSWLHWLRAQGVLHLVDTGKDQPVPPRWLADPLVAACLGIVLTPPVPHDDLDGLDTPAWLAAAPAWSIAGLLRASPAAAKFAAWLEDLPPPARTKLRVPLLHFVRRGGGRFELGFWQREARTDPFVLGEACVLRVDAGGWIERTVRPVNRDDVAWFDPPAGQRRPDAAWLPMSDLWLQQLQLPLRSLLKSVLAGTTAVAGAPAQESAEAWVGRCMDLASERLAPRLATLTRLLLRRTWPVEAAMPSLRRCRWLNARTPLLRQRRHELAALAPALVPALADGRSPVAARAVDHALRLVPALARDWRVPTWAARRTLTLLRARRPLGESGFQATHELAAAITACGPYAPLPGWDELPALAELAMMIPDAPEGFRNAALLRAAGREAARTGWSRVDEILRRDLVDEGPFVLLAWFDDLRHNAADSLAWENDERADDATLNATCAAWLQDEPLSRLVALSQAWHALLWRGDADIPGDAALAALPQLFGPMCLAALKVEVVPLVTAAALRAEAAAMNHCVATYTAGVATAAVLVLSLRCTVSGERATAAYRPMPWGSWALEQAQGPGNAALRPGTPLSKATWALMEVLHDRAGLDAAALARHFAPADKVLRAAKFAVNGEVQVRHLPAPLATLALRALPGTGPLELRVRRAANRAAALREEM